MLVEYRHGTRTPKLSGVLKATEAARWKLQRSGYTAAGHKLWTTREDDILRKLYPDCAAIKRRLRSRTLRAIRGRAQTLRIQTPKKRWTTGDISRLRKLWPTASHEQLLATFPGSSFIAIRSQAMRLGIRRRVTLLKTGKPLVDYVREYAHSLGYSMVELDCLAKSGQYFQSGCFSCGEQLAYIYRAVKRLGGVVKIEWPSS